jgi:hypothetical protein
MANLNLELFRQIPDAEKQYMESDSTYAKENRAPMTQTYIARYLDSHLASLGTILTVFGGFYLYSVIRTGWLPSDGVTVAHNFTSLALKAPVPSPYIILAFFITSLPAMIIGVAMLCIYTVRVLRNGLTADSEHVAILLTVCGLTYSLLGAWPLQVAVNLPWTWQKQIIGYGTAFAWLLYLLSAVMIFLGAVSLFVHSRAYHRIHPELALEQN